MADSNEDRTSLVADGTLGLAELTRNRENVTQAEPQLGARLARLEELQAELQGRLEQVEATQKELHQRSRLNAIDKRLTGLEHRDESSTPPGASSKEQIASDKPVSSKKEKGKKSGGGLATICFKGKKEEEEKDPQQYVRRDEPPDKPMEKQPSDGYGEPKETNQPKKDCIKCKADEKPAHVKIHDAPRDEGEGPQRPQIEKLHATSGFSSEEEVEEHRFEEDVPSRTTTPRGARQVAFETSPSGNVLSEGEPQGQPAADELSAQKAQQMPPEPPTSDIPGRGKYQTTTPGKDKPGNTQPSRDTCDTCAKEESDLPTLEPPTCDIPGGRKYQTTAAGIDKPDHTQPSRDTCDTCAKVESNLPTLEPPTCNIPGGRKYQTTAAGIDKPDHTQPSRDTCDTCAKVESNVPTLEQPTCNIPGERKYQTTSAGKDYPGDTQPSRDTCGKKDCDLPTLEPPTCDIPGGRQYQTATGKDEPRDIQPTRDTCDTCGKEECDLPNLEPPTCDIPGEGNIAPQQQPMTDASNEFPTEHQVEGVPQESPASIDTPGEGAPQTTYTGEDKADVTRPSSGTCGKEGCIVICSCSCGTVMPASSETPTSPCGCTFQCPDFEPAPGPKRASRRARQSSVDPKAQPRRPTAESQGKVPRKTFTADTSNCEPDCATKGPSRPPQYVPDRQQQFSGLPAQSAITPNVFNCGARRRTSASGAPAPLDTNQQTAGRCGVQTRRESAAVSAASQRQSCAPTGIRNQSRVSRRSYKDSRFSTLTPQKTPEPSLPSTNTSPRTCSQFDSTQAGAPADLTICGSACWPPRGTQSYMDASTAVTPDSARLPPPQNSSPATSTEDHGSSGTSCSKCRRPSNSLLSSAGPKISKSASVTGPCSVTNARDRLEGKTNVDAGPKRSAFELYNSRRSRTSPSADRRPSDRSFAHTSPQSPTSCFAGPPSGPPPKTPSIGSGRHRTSSVAPRNERSCARSVAMSFSDDFVSSPNSQFPQDPGRAMQTCVSACCPTSAGRSLSLSSFSTSQSTSSACGSPGCYSSPNRSESKPISSKNIPCVSSSSGSSLKGSRVQFESKPPQTPAPTYAQCGNAEKPQPTHVSVATSFSNPMMYPPQNQIPGPTVDPFQSAEKASCSTSGPPSNAPLVRKDPPCPNPVISPPQNQNLGPSVNPFQNSAQALCSTSVTPPHTPVLGESSPHYDTTSIASCPAFTTAAASHFPTRNPDSHPVNPSVPQSQPVRPTVSESTYVPSSAPAPYGYNPQTTSGCSSPAPSEPTVPLTRSPSTIYRGGPSQGPFPSPPPTAQESNVRVQDPSAGAFAQPWGAPRAFEPAEAPGAHLLPCPVMPVAGGRGVSRRRASQNWSSGSASRQSRSSSVSAYVGSTPCHPSAPTASSDAYANGRTGSKAGSCAVQPPASTSAPRRVLPPPSAQQPSGWTEGSAAVRYEQPSGSPRASGLAEAPAAHLLPCPVMPVGPGRRPSQNSSSRSPSRKSCSSSGSAYVGSPLGGPGFPTESSNAYPTGTTFSNTGSCTVQSPASTQSQRTGVSQSPCASVCGANSRPPGPAGGSVYPGGVCPSLAVPENHAPDGTFSCSHQCPAVAGTAPCPSLSAPNPEEILEEPLPDRFDPPITARCTHRTHLRPYVKCHQRPRCPNKINTGLSPCRERKQTRQIQDRCLPTRGRR